jgi:hypothetical protein
MGLGHAQNQENIPPAMHYVAFKMKQKLAKDTQT